MDSILNKAKKIKALADKGFGGERLNAERMLKEFMNRHGISESDICEDTKQDHYFKVPREQDRRLFRQVAYKIIGEGIKFYSSSNRKEYIILTCTSSQAFDIEMQFDFYKREFKADLDLFFSAFVQKNKLFAETSETDMSKVTPEELAKMRKSQAMAQGLERKQFNKQIGKDEKASRAGKRV